MELFIFLELQPVDQALARGVVVHHLEEGLAIHGRQRLRFRRRPSRLLAIAVRHAGQVLDRQKNRRNGDQVLGRLSVPRVEDGSQDLMASYDVLQGFGKGVEKPRIRWSVSSAIGFENHGSETFNAQHTGNDGPGDAWK